MKKDEDKKSLAYSFDHEIALLAAVDNLDQILDWVSLALEEVECGSKVRSQIAVVTEELFINIASYAYPGTTGKAAVRMGRDGQRLVMQFEDSGLAFNPLEQKLPDTGAGIEERKIGGLGIYLTQKWMDEIVYKRDNGKNVLTLYKAITTGA
jgi:anti-sigma regulatory factor (Ser/Thr protein kinase)